MSIFVGCTYHPDLSERLEDILNSVGVWHATASLNDEMLPKDIVKQLSDSYDINLSDASTIKQYMPGKSWQMLAANLFLANAKRKRWGWACPENVNFLNFWKDFDPQCRFVLVYSSPSELLARQIETNSVEDKQVKTWTKFNQEILKFYYTNREITALINIKSVYDEPEKVGKIIAKKFSIPRGRKKTSPDVKDLPYSPITYLIADAMSTNLSESKNLFLELEAAADLAQNNDSTQYIANAQNEYHNLKLSVASANETLTEREAQKSEITTSAETNLLKLQLNQVQDELQYYFCEYQKKVKIETLQRPIKDRSASNLKTDLSLNKDNALIIDLRNFIDGNNWHNPEETGRWAGPGNETTLNIPSLESGRYKLSINIISAMSLEIVKGLSVSFNENHIPTKQRPLSNLSGPIAALKRAKSRIGTTNLSFPILITGIINYEANKDNNPKLTFSVPTTIAPSAIEGNDDRLLSVFIKDIILHPLGPNK